MIARPLKKARSTSATDSSFASKVPTVTEPSGDGVHDLSPSPGMAVPSKVRVIPYGTTTADATFDMRIVGWYPVVRESQEVLLWVPAILAGLTCTLGTGTGVAASPVLSANLFCDTITVTSGFEPTVSADVTRSGTFEIMSPVNNLIAWAELSTRGAFKLEFIFDSTNVGAVSMNALFCLCD